MVMKLDAESAEKKARELLDSRIDAVRALVASRQSLADLQEQVEQAREDDLKKYRAALRDGWSTEELRKLGIDEPVRKRARKTPGTTRSKSGPAKGGSQPSGGEATGGTSDPAA